MVELIEMLNECSRLFYIGDDSKAWLSFSKLIELIQEELANDALNLNKKNVLITFVNQLPEVEDLKRQGNYTFIGDMFLLMARKLAGNKELN
jgi:hypothetical protein